MNNLTNPRWLFAINTFPLLLFSFLAYRQYTLIESLLEASAKSEWTFFAILTGILLVGVLGLAVWLDTAKKKVSVVLMTSLFMVTAVYLANGLHQMEHLVPWSIPRWLGGEDLMLYFITFSMPTLGYCLLGAVHYATPEAEQQLIWPNLLGAFLIPLAVYLLGTTIIPILGGVSDFSEHLFVIMAVVTTVAFLFFLVRGLYLLTIRKGEVFQKRRIWWMVPLAIIFPLLGLAVNNGDMSLLGSNVFGDFSHFWFYLLAGLNGLVLCLPAYDNKLYRLYLYVAKAIGMAFIAYFFLVFLPFLPLSLPAILFFGLGFLMLTPLLLFPVQLSSLREDRIYLTRYFDRKFLTAIGVVAFLLLPLIITFNYQRDKRTLNQALSYVYAPAEADTDAINLSALDRVLTTIDEHKGRRNDFGFGSGTPYLSSYYRWLVLDNLTLSDAKMNDLRRIFMGDPGWENYGTRNVGDENVRLTNTTIQTEWDPKQEAWSSWVELEITADSTIFRGEYSTDFDLPAGLFIADYYLYVGDRKEYGILAEKKAATWVYNNIVNENRDPGLLRYATANRVAFNVFPFAGGEVRRTGIRFLHKEPMSLRFDGRELALGRVGEHPITEVVKAPGGTTVYVPKNVKAALTQVQSKNRVHFVVDASRQSRDTELAMINRIKAFAQQLPPGNLQPKVTLAGTYPLHFDYEEDWENALEDLPEAGFFARRAIEEILVAKLTGIGPEGSPKIVVVTNAGNRPVLDGDFSAYTAALPTGDDFYFLDERNRLRRKQAETLAADPSLDLEEQDIRSMSEPGLIWGLLLLLLFSGGQLIRKRYG